MNVYFMILLILQFLNLGISLGKHGETVTKKYNFWFQLIGTTIAIILLYFAVKTGF